MNEYAELMKKAAEHISAGKHSNRLIDQLMIAAAEIDAARPAAFACHKPRMLQWFGGINVGDPLYLHPPIIKNNQ